MNTAFHHTLKVLAAALLCLPVLFACSSDDDEPQPVIRTLDPDLPAEQVAEQVARAFQLGDSLFDTCDSPEQLQQYADQIKALPGLESVEFNSQGMTIVMQNYFPISYIYPVYPDDEAADASADEARASIQQLRRLTRALDTKHQHVQSGLKSICIVDQLSHDPGFTSYILPIIADLREKASSLGISVTVLTNQLRPSFFESQAYKYDVLLILAHGGYDEVLHSHTIATSVKPNSIEGEILLDLNKAMNLNYYSIRVVKEKGKGIAGLFGSHYEKYIGVTDTYISQTSGQYDEQRQGKAAVFSAACHSMEGNHNMAWAFIDKGAAVYVGFDETQSIGIRSGQNFVTSLLSGYTLEEALDNAPADLKRQSCEDKEKDRRWTAHRVHSYGRAKNVQNTCYASVVTVDDGTIVDSPTSRDEGAKVLHGTARMLGADEYTYGFIVGRKEDLSDGKPAVKLYYYDIGSSPTLKDGRAIAYNRSTNTVTFEYQLTNDDIGSGGNLYYCAYMLNDKGSYCYGEIKTVDAGIRGELGLFELHGPVKRYTLTRSDYDGTTVRTFDRDGFWLTYNGESIKSIYTMGITRDSYGRIIEGRFDEGFESYEYDSKGRIVKYGYLYYDGGDGITYTYGSDGLLAKTIDEPWGMDAEYYDTEVLYYANYQLDDHGNWTQRTHTPSVAWAKGVVERRTIEYYDD